uniref:Putative response regulator receiver domain protein (CheY-like) n=1 Tax=Magnetococcus massalia (strain MO-1) TaxID=451514 RepID=A0A1S7LJC7_MAGMO|nr:putative response regulator receiver domain protein (CheY-like) [Candidatus Magnetococcus massalia]
MKGLIVDDLLENRKLLNDYLQNRIPCDLTSNGPDALDLFQDALADGDPYQLVLLDIMMPEMDGQEVLLKMRALESQHGQSGPNEAIIIMVTAADSPRHVLDSFFKGGCSDYLEKPVTRQTLLETLAEYRLL